MNIHSPDEPHLGEDHILQAVIDDSDLSTLQQQHLARPSLAHPVLAQQITGELAPPGGP